MRCPLKSESEAALTDILLGAVHRFLAAFKLRFANNSKLRLGTRLYSEESHTTITGQRTRTSSDHQHVQTRSHVTITSPPPITGYGSCYGGQFITCLFSLCIKIAFNNSLEQFATNGKASVETFSG
ncbi:conserved hypothetical protein [Trichinella spiralis]|uniref:hypothetical protein n=1 Tax=Trichinella spiralis TaxID=6334 RepID=UPI0001EFEAF3|nr:conserved hypothetical protein [Trichinella spiralis]